MIGDNSLLNSSFPKDYGSKCPTRCMDPGQLYLPWGTFLLVLNHVADSGWDYPRFCC